MKATLLAPLGGTLLLAAPVLAAPVHATPGLAGSELPVSLRSTSELDRSLLPADATMVAHFDLAGLQRTRMWKFVLGHPEFDLDSAMEGLAEVEAELGIDVLEDIYTFTAYSTAADLEPSGVLVVGSPSIDTAIERLQTKEEYRFAKVDGVELHVLEDVILHVHPTRGGNRLIIAGATEESVVRASRVAHGEAQSLADAPGSTLVGNPAPGSVLYVSTVGDLGERVAHLKPASQVFGLAQGIQFDLGEAGGSLFARAVLSTDSAERAREMTDIVEGLLAMGRMVLSMEEEVPRELVDLLRGIRVTGRGNEVGLAFEYSTDGLVEIFHRLEAMEREGGHESDH